MSEEDLGMLTPMQQDQLENAGYDLTESGPETKDDDAPAPDDKDESQDGAAPEEGDTPDEVESESTADSTESTWTTQEVNAAKQFGMSEDDLNALGEKGKDFAARLVKTSSDIGRRYSELGRGEKAARTVPEATPPEPPKKLEHTFDPEVYPAKDAEFLGSLVNEVNVMREMMAGFQKSSQAAQLAESERTADAFFASLDAKAYPQFGEGRGTGLDRNGPEMMARNKVWDTANEIALGRQLASGTPMDFEEALQRALLIEAPDAQVETARRNAEDRRKHQVPRPNKNRSTRTAPTGDEKAMDAMAKEQQRLGVRFFQDV